jgi:hypothetical protein
VRRGEVGEQKQKRYSEVAEHNRNTSCTSATPSDQLCAQHNIFIYHVCIQYVCIHIHTNISCIYVDSGVSRDGGEVWLQIRRISVSRP